MKGSLSRAMKMNHQQQQQRTPLFDLIEPPSILRTQISLAKPAKRDTSFSSFLQPNDLILPTKHKTNHYSEISIFDAEKYFSGLHDKNANGNITPKQSDVVSIPKLPSVSSMDNNIYGVRSYRTRSFHTTPTASSEASWNSQTGLLTNPPGSALLSIKTIASPGDKTPKSRRWSLRRKCPCLGEKSIQVEEMNSNPNSNPNPERKTQPPNLRLNQASSGCSASFYTQSSPNSLAPYTAAAAAAAKATISSSATATATTLNHHTPPCNGYFTPRPQPDQHNNNNNIDQIQNPNPNSKKGISSSICNTAASNGFTFPVLKTTSPPKSTIKPPPITTSSNGIDDPPRDSLEIFQPKEPRHSITKERSNCHFNYPVSPKSRRTSYDDDNGSDASSDLFEIESFSTQTTSFQPRDSMDENSIYGGVPRRFADPPRRSLDEPMTPSVAPTEGYAPSEASVVWSVTTAEGFDRASLTNFSVAAASEMEYGGGDSGADGGGGGRSKRRGNVGLLSCRNEDAVTVGPGPVKYGVDLARIGPGPPTTQNMRHVSGRAQPSVSKPPLGRSRSSFSSGPFAT